MSEPFGSTEPEPFTPQPAKITLAGCSRPALVGCGVFVVLLGVAAVVFVVKAKDFFGWAMERFEQEIVTALPDDVTAEERDRLSEAFARATDAVISGRADPWALQRLQSRLGETALKSDERLTRDEVLDLIRSLEEVGGVDDPSHERPPAGEVGEESTEPTSFVQRLGAACGTLSARFPVLA